MTVTAKSHRISVNRPSNICNQHFILYFTVSKGCLIVWICRDLVTDIMGLDSFVILCIIQVQIHNET